MRRSRSTRLTAESESAPTRASKVRSGGIGGAGCGGLASLTAPPFCTGAPPESIPPGAGRARAGARLGPGPRRPARGQEDPPMSAAPALTPETRSFVARRRPLLIDGRFVEAASGRSFPTYDPATGEVLAEVAEGDREDVERAVRAARRAFESGPWPDLTPSERGRLLWKLADQIGRASCRES